MPIYYLSGKYKLSINSFLEYWHKIVSMHNILHPSKRHLVHDTNVHKVLSALTLTITFMKLFTSNNTTLMHDINMHNIFSALNFTNILAHSLQVDIQFKRFKIFELCISQQMYLLSKKKAIKNLFYLGHHTSLSHYVKFQSDYTHLRRPLFKSLPAQMYYFVWKTTLLHFSALKYSQ